MKIEIDRREVISTQKELSELIGCPGYEGEVGAWLLVKIKPLVDKAWKDPLGEGPAITLADKSVVVPGSVVRRIKLVAGYSLL